MHLDSTVSVLVNLIIQRPGMTEWIHFVYSSSSKLLCQCNPRHTFKVKHCNVLCEVAYKGTRDIELSIRLCTRASSVHPPCCAFPIASPPKSDGRLYPSAREYNPNKAEIILYGWVIILLSCLLRLFTVLYMAAFCTATIFTWLISGFMFLDIFIFILCIILFHSFF